MRIAICDDETIILDEVSSYIKKYSKLCGKSELEVLTFNSASSLLNALDNGDLFDIFLLDVYIGDEMGTELAREIPECRDIGVLSGPQFAAEVARGVPTGSTLAGTIGALNAGHVALNDMYLSDSDDVIGTQVCGVGKNAVALISGYCSVACAGENERAMIFTRAWDEVVSIGLAMGAQIRTFLGLCGIGDLFLSATSTTSRNFSGGVAIASGKEPEGTVEGIFALKGLLNRARNLGIETPVLDEMFARLKI